MTPHRPAGRRPGAHVVRSTPHVHAHREYKKPAQIRVTLPAKVARRLADHTAHWTAWTNDYVVRDALPPIESAIVAALDRSGRPMTSRELSIYSWDVRQAGWKAREDAIRSLIERGVIEGRVDAQLEGSDPPSFTLYGFPEQFAESGDV